MNQKIFPLLCFAAVAVTPPGVQELKRSSSPEASAASKPVPLEAFDSSLLEDLFTGPTAQVDLTFGLGECSNLFLPGTDDEPLEKDAGRKGLFYTPFAQIRKKNAGLFESPVADGSPAADQEQEEAEEEDLTEAEATPESVPAVNEGKTSAEQGAQKRLDFEGLLEDVFPGSKPPEERASADSEIAPLDAEIPAQILRADTHLDQVSVEEASVEGETSAGAFAEDAAERNEVEPLAQTSPSLRRPREEAQRCEPREGGLGGGGPSEEEAEGEDSSQSDASLLASQALQREERDYCVRDFCDAIRVLKQSLVRRPALISCLKTTVEHMKEKEHLMAVYAFKKVEKARGDFVTQDFAVKTKLVSRLIYKIWSLEDGLSEH